MLMIAPPPAAIIGGTATLAHRNALVKHESSGVVPVGERVLLHWLGRTTVAGIVDEKINPAVAIDCRLHQPLDVFTLRGVAGDRDRFFTRAGDLRGGFRDE